MSLFWPSCDARQRTAARNSSYVTGRFFSGLTIATAVPYAPTASKRRSMTLSSFRSGDDDDHKVGCAVIVAPLDDAGVATSSCITPDGNMSNGESGGCPSMEADSSGADAVDDNAASLSSPSPNSLRFVRSAFMVAVQRRRAFGGGGIRASGLYFERPNLRAPPSWHLQFTPVLGQELLRHSP